MVKITNTTTQVYNNPGLALAEMLIGGPEGTIERQEAAGQRELVNSSVLPTQGMHRDKDRTAWEAMGIQIHDRVDGDEMFTNVTLPQGWKKRPTDHSMWSELVDNKGRVRGRIFYKAAFYDRSAHISIVSRFSVSRDYDRDDYRTAVVVQVKDCGTVVFASDPVTIDAKDWKASDDAMATGNAQCRAWLCEHGFSDYANAAAYWD